MKTCAKKYQRIISTILCVILVLSTFATPVLAATKYKVSGSTAKTKVIMVQTGKKISGGNYIRITPSKGVIYSTNKFTGKNSTAKQYGLYYVYITNNKTGSTTFTSMYKKTLKLRLDPNTTYSIRIEPKNAFLVDQLEFCSFWYYGKWKTNATWQVTKTVGVTTCR